MLSTLLIVFLVLALGSVIRTRLYSIGGAFDPNRELGLLIAILIIMAFAAGFVDLDI